MGFNKGNFKWFELVPNQSALGAVQSRAPRQLFKQNCSLLSLYVYLKDHKAETLEHVIEEVEALTTKNNNPDATFHSPPGSITYRTSTPSRLRKPISRQSEPASRSRAELRRNPPISHCSVETS